MVRLKGCNKCGGDLYMERDWDGAYVSCMQCGKVVAYLDAEVVPTSIDHALQMAAQLQRSA
jgi:hypothetical protein